MQTILNSLSTLDKEDGVGIQILIRPADPSWRKTASSLAGDKRKGKSGKKPLADGTFSLLKDIVGSGGGENKPSEPPKEDISDLEKSVVSAMEDKLRYPGFEVLIRVIASSNISQRAESIVNNIVASFSLFDAPGRNGFKYTAAKDIEKFVTSYILRFFPPDNNKTILNSVELASLFHFPDRMNIPTSQLQRQESKQVDGPRNMPEAGIMLGYNIFRGVKKAVRLSVADRRLHIYVVGQTGTGKSTFLENLALQDMLSGGGFAFVDPHGDTADRLLSMIPKERTEDVIYFSPADMEYPLGLNLFEFQNPDQKDYLIQESLNMLYKLYDPQHQGIMGPRYEHLFRNAALTVMADPAGGTFIDIPKLFRDPKFVQQKLQYVTDRNVLEFWQQEVPQSQRSNEFGEVTSWFISKFGAFLSNEMMRNIIGQTKSAFDLRQVMDEGKILLVNLSKGKSGELNSKLLGMIFVMKFQAAAMSRANIPEDQRRDFSLYVDEFQNFSTDSFATITSEARKFHLNLIVANQFTTQLTPEIREAVFGNMGTIVSFRIGQNDLESLGKYFQPTFDEEDLLRVPNYNTIVRTLIGGIPTSPFSMNTMPKLGSPNIRLAAALKQLSAAKYGRPRAIVEKEITDRMTTIEEPKPASSAYSNNPYAQVNKPQLNTAGNNITASTPPAPAQKLPAAPGSFLDEWLAKRKPVTNQAPSVAQPVVNTANPPQITQVKSEPIVSPKITPVTQPPNQVVQHPEDSQSITAQEDTNTKNISSDDIDKVEVHEVASELKQMLDSPEYLAEEQIRKRGLKTEHTVNLNDEKPDKDDTIYIDHDGTFKQANSK